ncbi:MAG: DNA polymerase IV [Desulfuromonadales bacterium]|nr:DNA polymerase IV [Desulfuromonadales bacterium]
MSGGPRIIMHLDMNAFFASVEQQCNPALRGQPLAVIGSGRTVVTTASYEARACGVKTGMNTWEARQACPQILFVVGNNRKYVDTSTRIIAMMRDYTPLVEVFSIDEAFLDVTGSLGLFGSATTIAYRLKARIRHELGLTCSIGIAPNKLLAKLASDMQKPDGLTVIDADEVASLMERLPVGELCGIGGKTVRKLADLNIFTCGQLGRYPLAILRQHFGIVGEQLSRMGRGLDASPVVPSQDAGPVKSVGHSMTLREDLCGRDALARYLLQLAEMVGRRARRHRVAGRTVHLVVRYDDFTTVGRQRSRLTATSQSEAIYHDAMTILDSFDLSRPVRLLGVRLTGLVHQHEQLPLFPEERRAAAMAAAMDEANDRFGEFTVTFGSLLTTAEKGSRVISPAWRPDGIRRIDVT